jgi:hypothetical protein
MLESGGGNLSCYPIATVSEGPGPRVGHAALLVGNAFIVFGGDTKMDDSDVLDDTLYLLNTCESTPFTVCEVLHSQFQLLANGLEQHLPDHARPDVMAIPSTFSALGYTSSEARLRVISSTT